MFGIESSATLNVDTKDLPTLAKDVFGPKEKTSSAPPALPAESKVQSTITTPAVDPGTITPPPPVINSSPTAPTPKPNEGAMRPPMPQQTSLPPPSYPYTISEMSGGDSHAPPSQYRAFNNARLYGEQSTRLVNGHFA